MKKLLLPAAGLLLCLSLHAQIGLPKFKPDESPTPTANVTTYVQVEYLGQDKTVDTHGPLKLADCVYFDMPNLWNKRSLGPGKDLHAKEQWLYDIAHSLRFYLDTSLIHFDANNQFVYESIPETAMRQYTDPFYFSKYEVTNNEYRQFVNWVRDSIAHTLLNHLQPNGLIDWKKEIDWKDSVTHARLLSLYLAPPDKKMVFYRFWINADQLVYRFSSNAQEARKAGLSTVKIYPDTMSWVNDFTYSYNEPMSNMYCWHPAYNNYPVVGVTYWQALAYLDWLTHQMQLKADAEKKNIIVNCQLPTDAQWEIVSGAETGKDGQLSIFNSNSWSATDYSSVADLATVLGGVRIPDHYRRTKTDGKDTLLQGTRADELYVLMNRGRITPGNYISDGFFHTQPSNPAANANLRQKPVSQQEPDVWNGVAHLGSNVSEWMRDDYAQWKPAFELHCKRLERVAGDDAQLTLQIERYYDKKMPANGKLVRGCSWFDERYGYTLGRNTAGINAKTFLKPDEAHSTIGFRYVVTTAPKPAN